MSVEEIIDAGHAAHLKGSLRRMFATGFARPNRGTGKPAGGGKPAELLQEKGSLVKAEEMATGVLNSLPHMPQDNCVALGISHQS